MISSIGIATAIPFLVAAAMTDLSVRMVPNSVCVALALDGLMTGIRGHSLPASLLGALCVFLPAAVCWRHGLMGGGDVKLLASVSLLVPAHSIPALVLTITLAGGVLAIAYWTMMRLISQSTAPRPRQILPRILRVERHRIRRGFSLPYAVAITAGTFFMFGHGAAVR